MFHAGTSFGYMFIGGRRPFDDIPKLVSYKHTIEECALACYKEYPCTKFLYTPQDMISEVNTSPGDNCYIIQDWLYNDTSTQIP